MKLVSVSVRCFRYKRYLIFVVVRLYICRFLSVDRRDRKCGIIRRRGAYRPGIGIRRKVRSVAAAISRTEIVARRYHKTYAGFFYARVYFIEQSVVFVIVALFRKTCARP